MLGRRFDPCFNLPFLKGILADSQGGPEKPSLQRAWRLDKPPVPRVPKANQWIESHLACLKAVLLKKDIHGIINFTNPSSTDLQQNNHHPNITHQQFLGMLLKCTKNPSFNSVSLPPPKWETASHHDPWHGHLMLKPGNFKKWPPSWWCFCGGIPTMGWKILRSNPFVRMH